MPEVANDLTNDLNRSECYTLRLRPRDRARLERASAEAGMRLSEFMRHVLLSSVERRLSRASDL
jgi:hypothetical protein